MSAVKIGNQSLTADPNTETLEWNRGVGEVRRIEYSGERGDVRTEYESLKNDSDIRSLSYNNQSGRSRLVATFTRDDGSGGESGVTLVEELWGVDLIRAIYSAPYFNQLTDDEVAAVLLAVEDRLPEAEIENFAGWVPLQIELRWQMLHGQESYIETQFVLRIRKQGVRSSALQGSFTDVNRVVAVPALSAGMTELVGTLPTGEWLKKPPQITYPGRGVWSVDTEFHYAPKWSIVYGGTLQRPII